MAHTLYPTGCPMTDPLPERQPPTPYTKLKRGESIVRQGFCGLGTGSRGKTFAPGHLYLTDRRLIVESRLETDRSIVTIALSAIRHIETLPDGFVLDVQRGDDSQRETIIIWGEAAAWAQAVEAARQNAPQLRQAITEGRQRSPNEKRRRTIIFGAVGLVGGLLVFIALCVLALSIWIAVQGG